MTKTDTFKSEKLEVRLTAEEKEILRSAAVRMELNISDFIRLVCLDVARSISEGDNFNVVADTFAGTATVVAQRLVKMTPFKFTVEPGAPVSEHKVETYKEENES